MNNRISTKKMTAIGMLCAMAYVFMVLSKIFPPVEGFLQYDAKDIVITIGGFILGPWYALIISVVVAVLELFTVSDTGFIGLIMNIISTAAFACTASFIYHKIKNMKGAFISLAVATIVLTAVMLLWNYYITPLYMKIPREVITPMLPTVFLPYKPIVSGLQKTGLVHTQTAQKKMFMPALITGIVLVVIFIPVILHMANVL